MKAPLWQYLIPKYGNYGGPGWSGGAMMSNYNDVDWSNKPVDSLDWRFLDHDKRYQKSIKLRDDGTISDYEMHNRWNEADKNLIKEISNIPIDPSEWSFPPTTHSIFYAWLYRKLAIYGFALKVWIYNLT